MSVSTYPYQYTLEVIFRDLDALGHVNNAVYFTYMEVARTKFLFNTLNIHKLEDLPIIVAEATCTYKSPAYFGEKLVIGIGISRFGTKSFDLHYRIEAEDVRLVALGKSVQVVFDYATGKTRPLPEDFKARVQALQGDWLP